MACSLQNIRTMQHGKHTRLTLETIRRISAYPCKHFFAIFRKFPTWGWDSLSSLCCNSPYFNLDDLNESPAENIQGNPVNLFELPVDGEDDKAEEIVLQRHSSKKK